MKKYKNKTPLQQFTINDPMELLPFLIHKQVKSSKSAIKTLLKYQQVLVNNHPISKHNHVLQPGDTVTITRGIAPYKHKILKKIQIIFEDDYLVVINKEAGVLSANTNQQENLHTAQHILNKYLNSHPKQEQKLYPIHRLDRDISGLMIFAKHPKIQEIMRHRWNEFVMTYNHHAIVEGILKQQSGIIECWLFENKNLKMSASKTDKSGLHAITHFQTLATGNQLSFVQLQPVTRRKNQLRAHMEFMKHPILGDKKYHAKLNPVGRICLHATELSLKHPITHAIHHLQSPLPSSMKHIKDAMKPL